jgi:tetratricopeptide (TPR) repeat protein
MTIEGKQRSTVDPSEVMDRAERLRKEKRFDEAAALLEEAIEASDGGTRAALLFRLGNVRIHAGDLEAAEAAYVECLDLDARHVDAMNNLAIVYNRQGRRELFAKTYRRSLWLSFRSPRHLFGGCRERSIVRILLRWVIFLGLALGVLALARWLFPR